MEEALERGFLKAPNRRRLQFALMWANHDWADYFPAPYGKSSAQWNMWLPSRHSPRDLERAMDYAADHYFSQSNYWRVDGRLFYSVFQPGKLVKELGGPSATRRLLAKVDRRLRSRGLPPVHWNGMLWSPEPVAELKEAGFLSTTSYNTASAGKAVDMVERYEDVMQAHRDRWAALSAQPLPHMPVVTMGWDVTPRCQKDIAWPFPPFPATGKLDYPYTPVVTGNTPKRFGRLCRDAAAQVAGGPARPGAVMVNSWNEWTEGSFLLPEKRHGTAYLKSIRDAFGVRRRRRG